MAWNCFLVISETAARPLFSPKTAGGMIRVVELSFEFPPEPECHMRKRYFGICSLASVYVSVGLRDKSCLSALPCSDFRSSWSKMISFFCSAVFSASLVPIPSCQHRRYQFECASALLPTQSSLMRFVRLHIMQYPRAFYKHQGFSSEQSWDAYKRIPPLLYIFMRQSLTDCDFAFILFERYKRHCMHSVETSQATRCER